MSLSVYTTIVICALLATLTMMSLFSIYSWWYLNKKTNYKNQAHFFCLIHFLSCIVIWMTLIKEGLREDVFRSPIFFVSFFAFVMPAHGFDKYLEYMDGKVITKKQRLEDEDIDLIFLSSFFIQFSLSPPTSSKLPARSRRRFFAGSFQEWRLKLAGQRSRCYLKYGQIFSSHLYL